MVLAYKRWVHSEKSGWTHSHLTLRALSRSQAREGRALPADLPSWFLVR